MARRITEIEPSYRMASMAQTGQKVQNSSYHKRNRCRHRRDKPTEGTLREKHHHRRRKALINRDQTMAPQCYQRGRRAACNRVHLTKGHPPPSPRHDSDAAGEIEGGHRAESTPG